MTHDQWRRAKPVLTQAISLDAAERDRLLQSIFQDEAGLRDELLKALADCHAASSRVLGSGSGAGDRPCDEADGAFLAPGDMCGHYRIVRLVGTGGMGQVYLATDDNLGTPAALKLVSNTLLDSPEARARLRREAAKAAQLRYHAHIATVLQFMELELKGQNVAVLAMEYVAGSNAGELLAEGRIAVNRALDWVIQIARALEFAHEKGILHCDIKPANVQVERNATGEHVKVLDFGIARALFERTPSEGVAGTPAYMAPEQLTSNECGPAADIYSLGVTLFELVTGRQPYHSTDPTEMLLQVIAGPVPRTSDFVSGVPRGLDAALQRAMAKSPEARYPTMAAFRKDLETLVPAQRPARLVVYFAAVALAVVVITFLGFVTTQALDQGLGQVTPLRPSAPLLWLWWGGRSLVAPIVFSITVFVGYQCLISLIHLISAFGPMRAFIEPVRRWVRTIAARVSSLEINSLSQLLLIGHVLSMGALAVYFRDVLVGLMNFMTRQGSIYSLRPANGTTHELFGYLVTSEMLIFCVLLYQVIQLRASRRQQDGAMYLAATAAAIGVFAFIFTARFQIISHNIGERVIYGSQTCYFFDQSASPELLFCPLNDPRNVRADLNRVEKTGQKENVFKPLDAR